MAERRKGVFVATSLLKAEAEYHDKQAVWAETHRERKQHRLDAQAARMQLDRILKSYGKQRLPMVLRKKMEQASL